MRRTLSPPADGKANHARSLRILHVGDRAVMRARLTPRARLADLQIFTD